MQGNRFWGTAALVLLAGTAAAGCAPTRAQVAADQRYMAGHFRAQADLRTSSGKDAGKAIIDEVDGGLRVSIDANNLPRGTHGIHIHSVGRCDAPGFTTAGGHWNPTGHQHGAQNPQGAHAGDLPNLRVNGKGRGKLVFTLPAGSFEQLLDEDGAALVIHADKDDLKTDPSGNSGARIACGVFMAM